MSSCSHETRLAGIPSRRNPPTSAVIITGGAFSLLGRFNQGRADALMWDDTVLVGLAAADRSAKLTNHLFV